MRSWRSPLPQPIPEPPPQPVKMMTERNSQQAAYQAVEELLRRAGLQKTTGTGYIQIDFVQGGCANVKAELKEVIKPQKS